MDGIKSGCQPQFFFHVPKTGGSTVKEYFKRTFGGGSILEPAKRKTFLVDVCATKKYKAPPSATGTNVVGHFASLSIIEGQEHDYHKACFWRHPADWALSWYNWRVRREKTRLKRVYSFSDMMGSLPHNSMTQDFLLYCGDVPGWRYFLMSDRQKFEAAIALARRFDVFADVAKVDDVLRSIAGNESARIHHYNTTPDATLRKLDPDTRLRLEKSNPVDYYVHLYALDPEREATLTAAREALSGLFSFRDLMRAIARVYYRFKVLVLPFV
jgi:hypothetical protein